MGPFPNNTPRHRVAEVGSLPAVRTIISRGEGGGIIGKKGAREQGRASKQNVDSFQRRELLK